LSPAESADIASLVRREQLALIIQANRNANPPTLLAALVSWAFLYHHTGDPLAIAWGLSLHAAQLVRYWWLARYDATAGAVATERWWFVSYIGLLGLNGVLWGSAAVLFMRPDDLVVNFVVIILLLAILSGALAWMTPVRAAVIAFSTPILILLALALALQPETFYRAGAVLTCIYLYSTLKVTMQHHRMLTESLHNRFANAALNGHLQRQMALVEKANAEKSRFLAAASHDLRQPATAIAFFSDAMERKLAGTSAYEDARRTKQAARALGQALESMLDISRLDAGAVTAQITPVPLQRVLQKINQTYTGQASAKGLQLRVRSSPLWVRSDEQHLDRMLGNVVSNAIKYTEEGGVLVLARRRGGQVVIDTVDTGIGIPAPHLDKVFDEFYQVDNPGRDRSQGLGIGLAIVKRLASLLAHAVEIRSRPGHGTRFRITAPRAEPGRELPPMMATADRMTAVGPLPRQVLVLDDEVDIVDGLTSLLAGHGVTVWGATRVEQALDALSAAERAGTPIEVFVCDVRLGNGVDGLTLVESLSLQGAPMPRIVLMTGDTSPQDVRRLHDSGYPVLPKPVATPQLLAELSRIG
jgi:signal transduction histidine kinase/ActR/RegA family two-component response regulator